MSEDICRWEDGKLIRCSKNTVKTIRDNFCKHCGSDLRKPKPKIEPGMFGRFFDLECFTKFLVCHKAMILQFDNFCDELRHFAGAGRSFLWSGRVGDRFDFCGLGSLGVAGIICNVMQEFAHMAV